MSKVEGSFSPNVLVKVVFASPIKLSSKVVFSKHFLSESYFCLIDRLLFLYALLLRC